MCSHPCHCHLVKVAPPHVYKLALYLELGLKPELVHNPSMLLLQPFSVASITLCLTFILFTAILTIRLRLHLGSPFQLALIFTLE